MYIYGSTRRTAAKYLALSTNDKVKPSGSTLTINWRCGHYFAGRGLLTQVHWQLRSLGERNGSAFFPVLLIREMQTCR